MLLHQFEPVVKRVIHVDVFIAFEGFSFNDVNSRCPQRNNEFLEPGDDESGMSLSRGSEIGIDTEMKLDVGVLKPNPTSGKQMLWLLSLRQSEKARVEMTSLILVASRHSQLNMVKRDDLQ
jgi:hypothetical protein